MSKLSYFRTFILLMFLAPAATVSRAQEDSALVRLLKGGNVPPERQGTIVEMIGKRGGEADLAFLLERACRTDGFAPVVRRKALDALTEAAITRKVRPAGDMVALSSLLEGPGADAAVRLAAARLVGLWKVVGLAPALQRLAQAADSTDALRVAALGSLAASEGDAARPSILALTQPGKPYPLRVAAVGALANVDIQEAARLAAGLLREAPSGADVQPMMAALLTRRDGPDRLVAALAQNKPTPDAAKLGLRAMYALGRADAALVATLSQAAGLDAEVKPLTQAEMDALIAEVAAQGDPARGETVFRRPDLNCARCHALGQAGGGIGPDLSPIGGSSPVDYIINALLLPDQAIKEEYHTLVVLTSEGQVVQGIVAEKDEKRVVLKEATGELRVVAADTIEDSKEGGSLMPKGLSNLMTHGEFVDLLRFLSELGKPGPYAIPATPVIMRWRVQRSDSDQFANVYAKVGGRLPLLECVAVAGGTTPTLQGEIEVSTAGTVQFRLDKTDGIQARVGETPLAGPMTIDLDAGKHTLILVVDTTRRRDDTLKVEVVRPEGSTAEFTVVGGR